MKAIVGAIVLVAFLYGVFEAMSGNAPGAIYAWAFMGMACAAAMTMFRAPSYESNSYRRSEARNRSNTHYTKTQWADLCSLYGNRCVACKRKRALAADHVIPLYAGGSDDILNIQPLCKSCNSRKGTDTTDYRTVR